MPMDWCKYCCSNYLNYPTKRYNANSNRITFVLRHSDNDAGNIFLYTDNKKKNINKHCNAPISQAAIKGEVGN